MKHLVNGKLPPDVLKGLVLAHGGASDSSVKIGPAVGEDAAVIEWDAPYLVVASDPITGATKGAGSLLVDVNANDVVCKGAVPRYLVCTVILPTSTTEQELDDLMNDLSSRASELGITLVGGHTEVNDRYSTPVLCGTLIGTAKKVLSASNLEPGDKLIVTKTLGIEGMSILAHDRPDLLSQALTDEEISEVRGWKKHLSVVPEGLILADIAQFMHDPTEGGFLGGATEVATLAKLGLQLDFSALPIHSYTIRAAQALGFDPKKLIASGTLLAVVRKGDVERALGLLDEAGIPARVVGELVSGKGNVEFSSKEELWGLLGRNEVQ